jgi:hypothetical protein
MEIAERSSQAILTGTLPRLSERFRCVKVKKGYKKSKAKPRSIKDFRR